MFCNFIFHNLIAALNTWQGNPSFVSVPAKVISYWHMAYAGDVNILGGSIHTVKENAEALVAATREIRLEVSADKTKYMVMSRDLNAGRIHSLRIDNSTFERVEEFKYLGTTLTDQHSIAEEIKSRLKSGSACYHSVQNLSSSRLPTRNLKSRYIEL